MLIWLNGPFGVGKTQTAFELHARLPDSFVFDPEEIGFALRKLTPAYLRPADFQEMPLWRETTRAALERLAASFEGPVIVPMTVVVPAYHQEIVGALRAAGVDVRHFTLLAPRDVVLKRLRGRVSRRSRRWAEEQLDRCMAALDGELFAEHVDTGGRSIAAVAEEVAGRAGLRLRPGSGALRRRVLHGKVQLRHGFMRAAGLLG